MRKRYKHNLSHRRQCTFQPGELYPVSCIETLPGDTFDLSTSSLIRCSPLLAPVMAKAMVRKHWFFVPNRVSWPETTVGSTGWVNFFSQAPLVTTLEVPSVSITFANKGTALARLYEALGAPLRSMASGSVELSLLAVRAYWSIWNEYFRDKEVHSALDLTSTSTGVGIQRVCWPRDPFTQANTSPQTGTDITIPLGTTAPVAVNRIANASTHNDYADIYQGGNPVDNETVDLRASNAQSSASSIQVELQGTADLTEASGATAQAVREAFALQAYAERHITFGSSYRDLILSTGTLPPSDGRLQKPELVASGVDIIQFSEVLQTSNGASGPDDVVGSMYGHGISSGRTRRSRYTCREHGYLICVASVVPEAIYADAIPRHFFKGFDGGLPQDDLKLIDDYWQPELERIGDRKIFKKELYVNTDVKNAETFGYGPAYDEYRSQPNQVTGDFYPSDTLGEWTWARNFSDSPVYNSSFVTCDPSNRIFADQSGTDVIWGFFSHRVVARRLVGPRRPPRIL